MVGEEGGDGVLGRQGGAVGGELPVDAEVGVVPSDGSFAVGRIVPAHLVGDADIWLQGAEAVCESGWYQQLVAIVGGQGDGDVLAEGG